MNSEHIQTGCKSNRAFLGRNVMREKAYCSDEHLCLYSAYGILNNENVNQLFTIYVFSLIKLALSFLIHKMGTIIFFHQVLCIKCLVQCFTFCRHSKTLGFSFLHFESILVFTLKQGTSAFPAKIV